MGSRIGDCVVALAREGVPRSQRMVSSTQISYPPAGHVPRFHSHAHHSPSSPALDASEPSYPTQNTVTSKFFSPPSSRPYHSNRQETIGGEVSCGSLLRYLLGLAVVAVAGESVVYSPSNYFHWTTFVTFPPRLAISSPLFQESGPC